MDILDISSFEAACTSNEKKTPDPAKVQSLFDNYNRMIDECRSQVEKRRQDIQRRWEEKRFQAAVWRDYQLDTAQRLYQAEVEDIEREFEEERARLKDKLISELLEERKRLMDELEPTLSQIIVPTSTSASTAPGSANQLIMSGKRSLRKRTNEEAGLTVNTLANGDKQSTGNNLKTLSGRETNSSSVKRRNNGNPYDQLGKMGVETRLCEEDIYDDINTIYREDNKSSRRTAPRQATAVNNNTTQQMSNTVQYPSPIVTQRSPERTRKRQNTNGPKGPTAVVSSIIGENLIEASVDPDASELVYMRFAFKRGDPVNVLVTQSDVSFSGTVSSIGPNELWIRREDGTKNKIYLGQLRIGKYKLAPPGQDFS